MRIKIVPLNGKFYVYHFDRHGNMYDSMHSFKTICEAARFAKSLSKGRA